MCNKKKYKRPHITSSGARVRGTSTHVYIDLSFSYIVNITTVQWQSKVGLEGEIRTFLTFFGVGNTFLFLSLGVSNSFDVGAERGNKLGAAQFTALL